MKLVHILIFLPAVASDSEVPPGDIISDTCPDGNFCFSGSTCMKLEKGFRSPMKGRTSRCDCSHLLTSGSDFYAGYGCDYDATDYCIDGPYATTDQKFEAFCTNGSCLENIILGEGEKLTHPGCNCTEGYEGDFCEYKVGTAPYKHSNKTAIGLGISLPLLIVAAVGGFLFKRRRIQKEAEHNSSLPPLSMGELQADHTDVV